MSLPQAPGEERGPVMTQAPGGSPAVAVLRELVPGERRVALVPAALAPLLDAGYRVLVESGAGEAAGFSDEEYRAQGAQVTGRAQAVGEAQVLAGVRGPVSETVTALAAGTIVVSQFSPATDPAMVKVLAEGGLCAFSLELLPRITRAQSMDVLSSQATVTGYRAVLLAAARLERFFPMLMTAAGTIPPARVFVLGAGVAGLQAVATARRLGAAVTAHDVRKAAKGEVESLGARFVELPELPVVEGQGGYAAEQPADFLARQREAIAPVVADADAVITTAAIPGRRAPLVLTAGMVAAMRPGSVVVDLAADTGGNCELSVAGEEVVHHQVAVIGLSSPASGMAQHASQLFARNMATFLLTLVSDGRLDPDFGDELIAATCVTRDGAMPQMVAIFNGVGGGAAALVALVDYAQPGGTVSGGSLIAVLADAAIGAISFSGSMIAFAKLQDLIPGRPITYPGQQVVNGLIGLAIVALAIAVPLGGGSAALAALAALALALGIAVVLPIGGADTPVLISLLNAFTGLAVGASGFVLGNTVLIVGGTLVGASGTLLTRMMSQAMGRSLAKIVFGAFGATAAGGTDGGPGADGRAVRSGTPADIGTMLAYSRKMVFVPGYGLAVAQAQHTIRDLAAALENRGVEISYAIHPVAGRMPGHMNVLLAEADVPHEQLKDMERANPELPATDVALVVGANDVVNPAARDAPGSPIYGMPILEVDQARAVVFLKRSMRPGFAGIENELLCNDKTTLLFGDAKDSLSDLVGAVKAV